MSNLKIESIQRGDVYTQFRSFFFGNDFSHFHVGVIWIIYIWNTQIKRATYKTKVGIILCFNFLVAFEFSLFCHLKACVADER